MNQPTSLSILLERAIAIAERQHACQVDKAGRPYIEHPKRVMHAMTTDAERIVAILHDVVEDTDLTLDQLAAEGFPDYILDALDSVTRRPGETYEVFVARAAKNSIGRRVKYADLQDNANLSRIPAPTEADKARAAKYHRAMAQLDAGWSIKKKP
jgi:(p)ppGpp synthase/HD superfamily hydrolase